MATRYDPLTFNLLEEGRTEADFNRKFLELQRKLCAYVQEHGDEASKGAKGSITMTVEIKAEDPSNSLFHVKVAMSTKAPDRPTKTTVAFVSDDDDGAPSLFVRRSGSTMTPPQQMVLATEDGRVVDPESGEVIDKRTGEVRGKGDA